jgi:alpha-galactosidase
VWYGWFVRIAKLVVPVLTLIAAVAATAPTPAATAGPAAPTSRLASPPMGWNDWNHFHCGITEQIVMDTADALVSSGLRDVGYRYVNVDDCWEAATRDADGRLAADPVAFPSGIAALAAYVHARGLKFGLYTAAGDKTCQGRPASGGHFATDAATFAGWQVDYVKLDWCGTHGDPHALASEFRAALDATGRPVVLSVSRHGSPWLWPDHPADLWRTSADIDDTWNTLLRNAEEEAGLSGKAGAGAGWNDPDMLQVGNGGMSADEYRAHLSLWAVLAAPLLMGNDVRTLDPATLAILGNREVIAVDQDRAGTQGDRVATDGDREVWARPLAGGDVAVALFNRGAYATEIRTDVRAVGLPASSAGYRVRDLWTHRTHASRGGLSAFVPAHGVALFRVSPGHAGGAAPLTTLAAGPGFLPAGQASVVTVTLRDEGRTPLPPTALGLSAPAGWTVRRLPGGDPVAIPGHPATARYAVTPPAGTPVGPAPVTVTAGGTSQPAVLAVPPPAPTGGTALSDHPAVQADNGWYLPLKVDHSFGDDFCGDCPGGTLTLAGTAYPTGLATYASAQVTYYLGGRCGTFDTTVGVDDEVTGMTWPRPQNIVGTARFQIYADGRLVYASGVRTVGGPPGHAHLDVRGVRELKLVDDSAADGNFLDHADWAGTQVTCPAGGTF